MPPAAPHLRARSISSWYMSLPWPPAPAPPGLSPSLLPFGASSRTKRYSSSLASGGGRLASGEARATARVARLATLPDAALQSPLLQAVASKEARTCSANSSPQGMLVHARPLLRSLSLAALPSKHGLREQGERAQTGAGTVLAPARTRDRSTGTAEDAAWHNYEKEESTPKSEGFACAKLALSALPDTILIPWSPGRAGSSG